MRTLKDYQGIFKKKGWHICMQEVRQRVQPLWWVKSRDIRRLILEERAYVYLKRKYGQLARKPIAPLAEGGVPPRIIWICWLQGMENAPEIVKRCYASVNRYATGYEIRVITRENLLDYVTMPDYILDKLRRGSISFTHFSDILRTRLLIEHGGIWLDSTVLLTGEFPTYITESLFFVFRGSWLTNGFTGISSWLIASVPQHPLLLRTWDLLCAYWKEHNGLCHYYLFHLMVALAVNENEGLRREFERMPYRCNAAPHTMQVRLFEEYGEDLWRDITEQSPVHKLTWKGRSAMVGQSNDVAEAKTVLHHILNQKA